VTRSPARFLDGERLAVLAGALTAVLLALTVALADAPYATGDEPPHVDYAYQLWHGDLPVFEDGLRLRPDSAWLAPVQWTAQHPPLYYLLIAPLVGPLADAGHPVAAVYAARGVNVLLAGVLVVAAWWSARRLTRPGSTLPVLVAFLTSVMAAVAHVGGTAYNDLLATLWVTVVLGLVGTVIRRGLDARLIALIAVVAAAASLTRMSAGAIAVAVAAVAVVAGAVRARQGRGRWGPVIALSVAGPLTVLAASGWFYLRNLALTGTITGSHFDWALANQNRTERPVWLVLVDPVTWARLPDVFWWAGRLPPSNPYIITTLVLTALLLLWTPLVIAARAALRRARRLTHGSMAGNADDPGAGRTDGLLLLALPAGSVVVAVTMQALYAANSGGIYPRYLLVVSLPLCLAVAAGLSTRLRRYLPVWTAISLVDLAVWLAVELSTAPPAGYYAELPVPAAVVAALACGTAVVSARAVLRANTPQASTAATATSTSSTTSAAS
jgi:hypothetical protein